MEVCVISGKGGTGKTTVSVGLAVALGDLACPSPVELLDCDVEASNAHFFLGHSVPEKEEVFPENCHGCGACFQTCSAGALTEGRRRVGVVRCAETPAVALRWGDLDVGGSRAAPMIQAVRRGSRALPRRIVDGPRGTSRLLVAAAKGADAALLVAEATPFGLHDLELAWRTVTLLGIPSAVVLNKAQGRQERVHSFCRSRGVPVLLEIPLDRDLAQAGARRVPLPVADPAYGPAPRAVWTCLEFMATLRRVA